MSVSAAERVPISVGVRRRIGGFVGGACVRVGGRGAQKVRTRGWWSEDFMLVKMDIWSEGSRPMSSRDEVGLDRCESYCRGGRRIW